MTFFEIYLEEFEGKIVCPRNLMCLRSLFVLNVLVSGVQFHSSISQINLVDFSFVKDKPDIKT